MLAAGFKIKHNFACLKPGDVAHYYEHSTWEAVAGA